VVTQEERDRLQRAFEAGFERADHEEGYLIFRDDDQGNRVTIIPPEFDEWLEQEINSGTGKAP
jgi:hypothetical protein